MNLEQLQRTFFELIRQPLTGKDRLRTRTRDGRSIKPDLYPPIGL